jgi:gamma-glutamyltranspeptidase/glutathione hydrolase
MRRPLLTLLVLLTLLATLLAGRLEPAQAAKPAPPTQPVAVGTGGAAASVDPLATEAAIRVLRQGGNAVDAAVAAAGVLGVVEPFSCGIGGGGFMVVYTAADERVTTIDARETAPRAFEPDSFIDPATGEPIPFPERVTSGLGVGVPGTLSGWRLALERFGTMNLQRLLAPAKNLATKGFEVDETFAEQTAANAERFRKFTSTSALFLPDGEVPEVGSIFRNPALAKTYGQIGGRGSDSFYTGKIAGAIVDAVRHPPVFPGVGDVRPGLMTRADLAAYRAPEREPAKVGYRGLEVFGMGPPSSGGSTVGESLNILEGFDLAGTSRTQALHRYLEASALAFADRNRYLGDSDFVEVPLEGLLSDSFAAERRALIGPTAAEKPVPPWDPTDNEGPSTTHLTVSDRWGNVVSYTFTIEQIGGSGIVVPGHGFLLNNELTDFEPVPGLANSPAGGKRPRSSMSPTIVLSEGKPLLALGSPGGSTIITTVLQVLLNRLDFGMTLPEAIESPRLSQRNTTTTLAEPSFFGSAEEAGLRTLGHAFESTSEIGAVTGIEFLPSGLVLAAAEPERRGGGSAMVEEPAAPARARPGQRHPRRRARRRGPARRPLRTATGSGRRRIP